MPKQIINFAGVVFSKLKFLGEDFARVLQQRMNEAELCLAAKKPLSAIILYGSVLEGVLFRYAECYPDIFKAAESCPKEKGKPKKISKWTLAQFIKVSYEIGLLKSNTMKYVDILKNFEDYITIHKQMSCGIDFSEDTAILCRNALVIAIKNIKKASDAFETEARQRVRLANLNVHDARNPSADKVTAKLPKSVDEKNVCIDPVSTSYRRVVANATNGSISRTK